MLLGGYRSSGRAVLVLVAVLLVLPLAGTVGGQAATRGSDVFDDVPAGHWADEPIGWAVDNEITRGVGGGRFGLDGVVTRAQIITFLYRTVTKFQGAPSVTPSKGSDVFDDVPAGHWADVSIGWAVSSKIIEGVDDATFGLEATVPRSEIVALLHRTTNLVHGKPLVTVTGPENAITFDSNRDGDAEVFVMDADGTNERKLTNNTYDDQGPVWSPDSTQIAFFSIRDEDREIYVVNADGTNERQLTNNTYQDWDPSWSPDGSQIAFTSDRRRGFQIFIMNADGTNERQLTGNFVNNAYPTWSPDGTMIAFGSDRDGDWEIFVMNADGTNVRQLTSNSRPDERPSWSPDGTRIAFHSEIGGHYETLVMNTDGTDQRQLTRLNHNPWGVSWSPDSSKLVYGGNLTSTSELFVINADGSDHQQLTDNIHYAYVSSQAWSHDTPRGSDFFDDVPPEHEADPSIGWAVTNGITSGVGNRKFDPDGTVTRAQIVTFLYRTVNLLQDPSGT